MTATFIAQAVLLVAVAAGMAWLFYVLFRFAHLFHKTNKAFEQRRLAYQAGKMTPAMRERLHEMQWIVHLFDTNQAQCVNTALHHYAFTLPNGKHIPRMGIVGIEGLREELKGLGQPTSPPEINGTTATILPFKSPKQ